MNPEKQAINVQELLMIIGEKEVQLSLMRGKFAMLVEANKSLQARIAELEFLEPTNTKAESN